MHLVLWVGLFSESMKRRAARLFRLLLTLSLPRAINFKLPLQPQQKYYIIHYFFHTVAYSEKKIIFTSSHKLTYTFPSRKVGRMYFLNLRMKGLLLRRSHGGAEVK